MEILRGDHGKIGKDSDRIFNQSTIKSTNFAVDW